ncbi:proteophosphoglycan ppg4 [Variovorax sp. LjRoot290]|uniref:proteophosphoglycan ppg4 n=1 Tax=unclassified Variovorax TaxID=663243 RepID=UPI003ECFD394
MNARKHLLAVLALGASGFAFAQATPPTTSSPDPATAVGQQSPAGGPMGSTGTSVAQAQTPTSPGTTTSPSQSQAPAAMPAPSTDTTTPAPMSPPRADRN